MLDTRADPPERADEGLHESGRALLGPREISDLSPQSGAKRTLTRLLSPIAIYEYALRK
jgi:hypothetical protein